MASAPTPIASSSLPLRIEGLVKRFDALTAVDGISLDLNRGECMGLLGANGAGKSTLRLSGEMKRRLNMAAGLIHHPGLVLMDEPTVAVGVVLFAVARRLARRAGNIREAGKAFRYT
jgi:ABC-type multidrug transport system ATPase subunit